MKLLNLSTALLAPLAAVLLAPPAAAAKALPFGLSPHGSARLGGGADRADREPFALRFSGFLPVDYLQWAPKQEGEPEIRLARCLPESAPSDDASPKAKGVSEWNRPSHDLAKNGQGPANDSPRGGHAHGGNAKVGYAEGQLQGYGRRGHRGHDKHEDPKPDKNEPEDSQAPGNAEGPGADDAPTAPPAAPSSPVTPVPEPTTALFGAALLGVCGLARRRPRQAPPAR